MLFNLTVRPNSNILIIYARTHYYTILLSNFKNKLPFSKGKFFSIVLKKQVINL
jgi:hypothetical protein